MKISQGEVLTKKKLFYLNLEDEKMDFPSFSKKKILRLAHENSVKLGVFIKKYFFA